MIQTVTLRAVPTLSQIHCRQRAGSYLRRNLPWLPLDVPAAAELPVLRLNLGNWQHPSARIPNFDRLFRRLDQGGNFRLVLWSHDWLAGTHSAYELLNRYQALLPAPPGARTSLLDLLPANLTGEPELEHRRRIDTWCWLRRLRPCPSETLERAALLGGRPDLGDERVLSDAGDLAFFNVASWWFLEHREQPVVWSELFLRVARMSEDALCLALSTRQPPAITRMLEGILDTRMQLSSYSVARAWGAATELSA
jgi:hypothetical protein